MMLTFGERSELSASLHPAERHEVWVGNLVLAGEHTSDK
jgi:hypothetical protein